MQEDTYRGDGLNLYAYCANNPVCYVDPNGHQCEKKNNSQNQSDEYDINNTGSEMSTNGKEIPLLPGPVMTGQNRLPGPVADTPDDGRRGDGGNGISKTKSDFYVTPSGNVIPSTGYRYVSENAPYLNNMSESMIIPANNDGTYLSFDNYDIANPGALQVPHDASVKVSFDMLQIIDDISIPHGNWGKASHLEPITSDFPQFGPGGATQVITHSQINIDAITQLPKN